MEYLNAVSQMLKIDLFDDLTNYMLLLPSSDGKLRDALNPQLDSFQAKAPYGYTSIWHMVFTLAQKKASFKYSEEKVERAKRVIGEYDKLNGISVSKRKMEIPEEHMEMFIKMGVEKEILDKLFTVAKDDVKNFVSKRQEMVKLSQKAKARRNQKNIPPNRHCEGQSPAAIQ